MKMRWGRRPSPAEVAKNIAALERELGIDDKSVLAEVEQQKLERFNSKRGPVLLDKRQTPRDNPDLIEWGPGAKLLVNDPSHIQFFAASAVPSNFHQVIPAPRSRVVLPAGVRV